MRACEDDDVEQVRQTVNIGTPTEPVTRPDLLEQVPESYFPVWDFGERIPMTIMVSQKYLLPPPPPQINDALPVSQQSNFHLSNYINAINSISEADITKMMNENTCI